MILIIGTQNCSRCNMTKTILDKKNIEYTYKLSNDISKEELNEYMKKARIKGLLNFPLIIKNDEIIEVQEII
ncbi:MAG: hypothetical protein LLF98_01820 [Clostridium sp.]|uniref:glutaredoxin family protein n=1 Tax=Clostridium sp. TaxID=1506 RepID=UPI0025BFF1F4|nr:glutaredoxin domain-containing protein [Clostridium sp.]MCE5220018.1 hypothetical protein [Clostridium sp.]